ncbi:alpha/beta-hydrolase [Exidia glandulosa HHB12029]|uniref:Alpha/beta-hydrolase n=1 Tax=Exidia glandulosa HHB12029 TaxID=1314781 RepID=A0A165LQ65_EXIGL|nr:alpha/beta-hydrolase [Exidia glandulosa HHB12029]
MPTDSGNLAVGAHAFTTSTNATLTYFVTGTGPLVLVNVAPGWGCASGLYHTSFGQEIYDAFTLLHLECRGTRGSSFPEDMAQMSSWHMAEDVDHLREHLELEQLDVLGHSNGGVIALWYAIRFPTRVRRLVLMCSNLVGPRIEEVRQHYIRTMLAARPAEEADAVAAFHEYAASIPRLETDEQAGSYFDRFMPLYLSQPERDIMAWRAAFSEAPQVKVIKAHSLAESAHFDQEDQLGAVTAPTLVMVGKEDFICAPAVSEAMAANIKNSTLSVLDDAGHVPWIEQREKFAQVLFAFFDVK